MDTIWDRFYTEYVATLNTFVKNSKRKTPYEYEVGEFVHLLKDGKLKQTKQKTMAGAMRAFKGRYHFGEIKQIHPGLDGFGRQFVVDTGAGWKTYSYMTIAPLFI